ncbi:hypothetical protein TNCV_4491701 [Trichonephila clavipes]|nr:hypothetical protein TNCV_4491701 [Trichonephila clavipes]
MMSDNGSQFIYEIFEHLSNRLGIQHVKTVVYKPQSDRTELPVMLTITLKPVTSSYVRSPMRYGWHSLESGKDINGQHIDQVRFYYQRKSDENVIRVENSDSNGSSYQASGFEGGRPRSDCSQNRKNRRSGERRKVKGKMTGLKADQGERHTKVTNKRRPHVGSSKESLPQKSRRLKKCRKEVIGYKRSINSRSGGPERKRGKAPVKQGDKRSLPKSTNSFDNYRKKVRGEEAAMPERDTSRYNLWSRRKIAESRLFSGQIQDQGGPVWSRGKRYQEFRPYIKIKEASSIQQARVVIRLREDGQLATLTAVPLGLGSNPGEDMDVCKCIVPSGQEKGGYCKQPSSRKSSREVGGRGREVGGP